MLLDDLQRIRTIGCDRNLVAGVAQHALDKRANRLFVVNDEHRQPVRCFVAKISMPVREPIADGAHG